MEEERWREAKAPLQRLLELCPESTGPTSPYALLAAVYRKLDETREERAVLEQLATLDSDAVDAYLRLMELAEAQNDQAALTANAERLLAVYPLLAAPHRHLARAAEASRDCSRAIRAYRALLLLDPVDPAEAHYRLASLYCETGDLFSARLHVLKALEEAPRFRAAHRLLVDIAPRFEAQRRLEAERQLEAERKFAAARALEAERKLEAARATADPPVVPEESAPVHNSSREKRF
jgi:tetratricopeptide (TPR) repeat protein